MKRELIAIMAWKPYSSLEDTKAAIVRLEEKPVIASHKYYLALPFDYLQELAPQNQSPHLVYGATAMNSATPGTFTSSIAGKMLKKAGAQFVLLGTYYSRQLGMEDNAAIRNKILNAVEAGLIPLLCIGETLQEFEQDRSEAVLEQQLQECVKDFTDREWKVLQIVYEAPWINSTASMPSWDALSKVYQRCRALVQRVCGRQLPVLCGVPDDILDLPDFVERVSADGYFFSHASLHLEVFTERFHLALPAEGISEEATLDEALAVSALDEVEPSKVEANEEKPAGEESEESNTVAEVVKTAVLAAAREVEEEPQDVTEAETRLEPLQEPHDEVEEEFVEEQSLAESGNEEEVTEEEIPPEIQEEVVEAEPKAEEPKRSFGVSNITAMAKEESKKKKKSEDKPQSIEEGNSPPS